MGLNNKLIQPHYMGCLFTSCFLTPNFIGGQQYGILRIHLFIEIMSVA